LDWGDQNNKYNLRLGKKKPRVCSGKKCSMEEGLTCRVEPQEARSLRTEPPTQGNFLTLLQLNLVTKILLCRHILAEILLKKNLFIITCLIFKCSIYHALVFVANIKK